MEDSILIKQLTNISENIKSDKDRLNNILTVLNSGKDDDDINGVLINSLTDLEHADGVISSALEYITLLFTNAQTQRHARSKEIIEELVIILKHNIDLLNSIESCVVIFNKDITTHLTASINDIKKHTDSNAETLGNISTKWYSNMAPSNPVSNSIFWGIIFCIVVFVVYKIDDKFTEHATDAVTTISTIKDKRKTLQAENTYGLN